MLFCDLQWYVEKDNLLFRLNDDFMDAKNCQGLET